LGAFINAGLLYRYLRKADVYRPSAAWRRLMLQVTAGCIAMGGVLWIGAADLPVWVARGVVARVEWLLIWIGAGIGVYFLVLALLGVRPRQFIIRESA
jgi:putative peptidoglycan lipid II flippase